MAVRIGRICPVCKGEYRDDYGNRIKCAHCGSTGCVFTDCDVKHADKEKSRPKVQKLVTS